MRSADVRGCLANSNRHGSAFRVGETAAMRTKSAPKICNENANSLLPTWRTGPKAGARFANHLKFMSEKSIAEKVKDIIVEQLGVNPEQVTENASFIEDLGADSLDTVELVMAFEEEFGVEVPDEDAEKLQAVGDVVKYIEDKQK